jgi:hypothetical protein
MGLGGWPPPSPADDSLVTGATPTNKALQPPELLTVRRGRSRVR